jgi:hypothetical protein
VAVPPRQSTHRLDLVRFRWLARARDDAPECHRCNLDRPHLVARPHRCGAMARLID